MMKLFEYYDYISLTDVRFLFVARIKFAKTYSKYLFDKEYLNLEIEEKFYLTYYIFCLNFIKSYDEFQKESNYKIIRKNVNRKNGYFERKIKQYS